MTIWMIRSSFDANYFFDDTDAFGEAKWARTRGKIFFTSEGAEDVAKELRSRAEACIVLQFTSK